MNFDPREQVAQLFVEIPRQLKEEGNTEKAAHHTDLSQGYDGLEDDNASMYDNDRPYYDSSERYD